MGAGLLSQFVFMAITAENHTTGLRPWKTDKPRLRALEMHPYSRYAGLPPEGEVFWPLSFRPHKYIKA